MPNSFVYILLGAATLLLLFFSIFLSRGFRGRQFFTGKTLAVALTALWFLCLSIWFLTLLGSGGQVAPTPTPK